MSFKPTLQYNGNVSRYLYTQTLNRVFDLAADEACWEQHSYIGTEHMLLAILRVPECLAHRILVTLRMPLAEVEARTRYLFRSGPTPVRKSELYYTPSGRHSLLLAIEEVKNGCNKVSTGHLLLGLIRQPERSCSGCSYALAAAVLCRDLELDLEAVRQELRSCQGHGGDMNGEP